MPGSANHSPDPTKSFRVAAISVTPSPYQRDLFHSLSRHDDLQLDVFYLEHAPDDSPWDAVVFEPWESVLPGTVIGRGRVRCHINTNLPDLQRYQAVILNAPLTASTTQRVIRNLRAARTIPWVFWAEQLLPRQGWKGFIQRFLAAPLASANAIAAIGSRAATDYRKRFPKVQVFELPYACNLEPFRRAAATRPESPTCRFIFAGQMIARKGVDVLLSAFSQLVDNGLDVSLTLVGRQASLNVFLDPLPKTVRARIDYLGFLQPPELPAVFSAADVFVLPSRHDGWGVVVNQALGSGLPVITTTSSGAGFDLVDSGKNGVHVPPDDSTALTDAMRALAKDPLTRKTMSLNALAKAEAITPEAIAKKWLHLLVHITNSSHPTSRQDLQSLG